jgi:hypothetical protein
VLQSSPLKGIPSESQKITKIISLGRLTLVEKKETGANLKNDRAKTKICTYMYVILPMATISECG